MAAERADRGSEVRLLRPGVRGGGRGVGRRGPLTIKRLDRCVHG